MKLPPLSMLRAFEAAARLGGFAPAGRELNVTHAAVAQQVRRLEAYLSVELMRRRGRGMELTEVGAELARTLGRAFAMVERALADAAEAERARPVRVTTAPMVASVWIVPRLGEFRQRHPEIELVIDPSSEAEDLASSGHDLAVRYGDGIWPGLHAERLLPTDFVVVAAPALLKRLPPGEPPDLTRLPWLQEYGRDELRTWLRGRGVEVGPKTDITHLPGYMMAVALRHGQGAGATSRFVVEEDIREGRLVVLHEESGGGNWGYHLCWPEGSQLRPAVRAFADWLRRTVEAPDCQPPGPDHP